MKIALLQALGIASGGILAFGSILIVLLLLNTPSGPKTAAAYVFSYTLSYFGIGSLSLWVNRQNSNQIPTIGPIFYTLLGFLLLFFAIRQYRAPPEHEVPTPKIFAKLDTLNPIKASIFGIMVTLFNAKNLGIFISAIDSIASASMTQSESLISLAAVTLVFCSPLMVPLIIYALMPKRAAAILSNLRKQIERHRHKIILILLPLFATLFLTRGIQGLWPALFS